MNPWKLIDRKRIAYQETFLVNGIPHPQAALVLKDLRKFCGVSKPGIVVNPISRQSDDSLTAYRAGQRDVFARIEKYLNLAPIEQPIEDLNDE